MALCYDDTDVHLHEYVDSNFAGNVDSRKSITGYVFTFESGAWVSRLQKIITFVYDGGRICCNDRSLQGVYMVEEFHERVWQGACDS